MDFIVGSLSASVQLAVNNVTKQRNVLFNSISQSDQITAVPDWSRYTFHEALTPHLTAGAVGRYAFAQIRQARRVPQRRLRLWPRDGARASRRPAQAVGIEVLADVRHPLGTTDFSTLLPRIQALKPDILCIMQFRPRPADLAASRRPISA